MYSGEGPIDIARMERMRDQLPPKLNAIGAAISPAAASYLATAPATNTSAHAVYAGYYGSDLRDLVAERDADIIAQYGYSFGA
jgi:hypothetical protein